MARTGARSGEGNDNPNWIGRPNRRPTDRLQSATRTWRICRFYVWNKSSRGS
jgi:hypothetical protein